MRKLIPALVAALFIAAIPAAWGINVNGAASGDVNNAASVINFTDVVPVGRYNATLPTLTDTQYGMPQLTTKGSLMVTPTDTAGFTAQMAQGNADGASASNIGITAQSNEYSFNGSSWDRNFACTSFAAISVTAANTTQIIALSGSKVIRICNAELSISATGSFHFLSGTGSNCGTPAQDTGAVAIASGTLQNISGGGPGMAVYRGTAGGEFCVQAVTGNVTGWVMYAQY